MKAVSAKNGVLDWRPQAQNAQSAFLLPGTCSDKLCNREDPRVALSDVSSLYILLSASLNDNPYNLV